MFTIGVFMGGRSLEAEVSFNSGRTVCDHIDATFYKVIPLFQTRKGDLYILPWHFLHRGKIKDFEHRLISEAEKIEWDTLPSIIDFAYIAQHGRYAEDGILQGILEVLKIPYLGSKILASALGMNKALARQTLIHHGIEVPRALIIPSTQSHERIYKDLEEGNFTFPLVIKPVHEGSSHGVFILHDPEKLSETIEKASTINQNIRQDVLIEEYQEGKEFSCITLQKNGIWHALTVTELIKNKESIFDYEQKYMPGKLYKKTPATLAQETLETIKKTCINTSIALGFQTIGRIDGIYTNDGRIVIIDPNSLSGMAPNAFIFDQAALHGWSHKQLINHLITEELQHYKLHTSSLPSTNTTTMHTTEKIKIGVMFGGNTHEREVSLDSGRNVIYKLNTNKYTADALFIDQQLHIYKIPETFLIKNSTQEISDLLTPEMRLSWSSLKETYDFIFLGLHGGAGENGSFQGFLEMLDIPYNGSSVFTSALCMDKYKTTEWLSAAQIDTPAHQLIDLTLFAEKTEIEQEELLKKIMTIPFPIICKPHNDGCSVLVEKINEYASLRAQIPLYIKAGKTMLLCEEYIEGIELTVGVLGNEKPLVLPASQTIRSGNILSMEEKFLPGAGENQTPALLSPHAQKLVSETIYATYQAVKGAGYARIDCFYQDALISPTGKERVVIIEINTLPALTPATCLFHQAAEVGIRPGELLDKIIEFGFENHRKCVTISREIKNFFLQ